MKFLLAMDGSVLAHEALGCVLELAREGLTVEVLLANVQEPANLYEMVVAHDTERLRALGAAAAEHLLAPARDRLQAAGVAFEVVVAHGEPAALLVDLAEQHGCQALFIGAHGKGVEDGVGGAPGSVAQAVLAHARCPVTVVPPPPMAESAPDDEASEPQAQDEV